MGIRGITAFLLTLSVALFLAGCGPKEISPAKMQKLMKQYEGTDELVVLDLRGTAKYNQGHISGADNYHFYSNNFEKRIEELSEKEPILIIYCGTGLKTGKARDIVKKYPFKKVYILEKGLKSWNKKGLPLE